ncbi:PREDICTED: protein CREG1-like [Nicrophorus vespilloides]|uniref:Protein CREG1-like n=1 Tax=Nicrophorus vespilloides TaxID=110193 RepID=A0ABM1MNL8_NICVS|nr:PREDICTED: protein CREG1-like [Nicrophorus vespilloides]
MKVSIIFCLLYTSVYAQHPPNPSKLAEMARYIINAVDWISISTISTYPSFETYPFSNIMSVSDGPVGKGAGTPYFLLTHLDLSAKDLLEDNRTTIVASLAQVNNFCNKQSWDPQDPRCGKVMLVGRISKVNLDSSDLVVAMEDFITRHPTLKGLINTSSNYLAKLNIEKILLLDSNGPTKNVDVKDYFKANNYFNSFKSSKQEVSDVVVQVKMSKTGCSVKIESD